MEYRDLNETFKRMLNENKESKMRSKARAYTKSMGYDDMKAKEIESMILHDIPNVRLGEFKFMLGVTRILLSGGMQDGAAILKMNQYLRLITNPTHIEEYDNNLNGLTFEQIDNRFKQEQHQITQDDIAKSNSRKLIENKAYTIVSIPDFETAEEYGDYVSWCVTHDESMYNSYTHGGLGIFYFCLKDGFENLPETPGEGCPLDEYGLSMIAVSINEDKSCNTITCRWNHDNGGNDGVMSIEQLEQIIGRNFYNTFKPRSPEEIEQRKRDIIYNVYYEFQEAYENFNEDLIELVDRNLLRPLFDWDDVVIQDTDNDDGLDDDYEQRIDIQQLYSKLFVYTSETYDLDELSIIVFGNGDLAINEIFDNIWECNGENLVYVKKEGKINIINVNTGQYLINPINELIDISMIWGSPTLFNVSYKMADYHQPNKNIINGMGDEILPENMRVIDDIFTITEGSLRGMVCVKIVDSSNRYNIALIDKAGHFYGNYFKDSSLFADISIIRIPKIIAVSLKDGSIPGNTYILYSQYNMQCLTPKPVHIDGYVHPGQYRYNISQGSRSAIGILFHTDENNYYEMAFDHNKVVQVSNSEINIHDNSDDIPFDMPERPKRPRRITNENVIRSDRYRTKIANIINKNANTLLDTGDEVCFNIAGCEIHLMNRQDYKRKFNGDDLELAHYDLDDGNIYATYMAKKPASTVDSIMHELEHYFDYNSTNGKMPINYKIGNALYKLENMPGNRYANSMHDIIYCMWENSEVNAFAPMMTTSRKKLNDYLNFLRQHINVISNMDANSPEGRDVIMTILFLYLKSQHKKHFKAMLKGNYFDKVKMWFVKKSNNRLEWITDTYTKKLEKRMMDKKRTSEKYNSFINAIMGSKNSVNESLVKKNVREVLDKYLR